MTSAPVKAEAAPFEFEGDLYCPVNCLYKYYPKITGLPDIEYETSRVWQDGIQTIQTHQSRDDLETKTRWYKKPLTKTGGVKKERFRVPVFKQKKAPRECNLRKLINWPFAKLGGYQCAIIGTYGYGKSNLLNLMMAFHLAQNVRLLTFNDRRFEARSLADKGYFDKNGKFTPFHIDVFVPEGYEFKKANPLWEHRNNVHRVDWSDSSEILAAMKPHRLTVVYTECLDQASTLRLWIELMESIAESVSPNKNYIFTHHEFSSLIPEVPMADIAKIVRAASVVAMNLRKDRIGIITTFHMLSEVYYRFSQKFTHVIYKRPVIRKSMARGEKDAQGFGRSKFNLVASGRWMTHSIGMFPEVPDKYRLMPLKEKLVYPGLQAVETDQQEKKDTRIKMDPLDYQLCMARIRGDTLDAIGDRHGMPPSTVNYRIKRCAKQ